MEIHNHNLNIHYSAPKEVWDKLEILYKEMPKWDKDSQCPQWYGYEDKIIQVSVEPSGLQFYAELADDEWESWFTLFKKRASDIMGYEVGEIEDGYEFHYWNN